MWRTVLCSLAIVTAVACGESSTSELLDSEVAQTSSTLPEATSSTTTTSNPPNELDKSEQSATTAAPPPTLPGFEPLLVAADEAPWTGMFCGSIDFDWFTRDQSTLAVFDGDLLDYANDETQWLIESLEGVPALTYYELENTADRLHLFGVGSGHDGSATHQEIAFVHRDGGWQFDIWAGCSPQIVGSGWSVSDLRLDSAHEPNASSTSIVLWVTERSCASGKLPEGRKVAPILTETEAALDILVMVQNKTDGANCQGNPSFPIVVDLEGPLGEREIRNVAFEPAVRLEWPIPLRDSETSISVGGDAPQEGRANAVLYHETDEPEGYLFEETGWSDFGGGPVVGFTGLDQPLTVEAFVTDCGDGPACDDGGCVMEGDPYADEWIADGGRWCAEFPRVGETCVVVFEPDPLQDALISVEFSGESCSIVVDQEPIE